MNELTRPGSPSLLRLIVELKGSELPSNAVYLLFVGDREPEQLACEIEDLERASLITWSEGGQQWTPTMKGLGLALNLPAFDPAQTPAAADERAA